MADQALGLTDHAQEMAKWNKPYVYAEFPKMLFRGTTTTAGRVEVTQRIVATEREESDLRAVGWCVHPETAKDAETARQEAIGTAAAERAYTDRRMSASAQAEAAAADQAAGAKHLGAIPERPRKPRPSRAEQRAKKAAAS
jgi:hypothetical protein